MVSRVWAGDRVPLVTLALLSLVTIAAWAGVIIHAGAMAAGAAMGPAAMDAAAPSGGRLLGVLAEMSAYVGAWVVMMAAMMLPSAAPMILLYHTAAGNRPVRGGVVVPAWIFVLGYLVVWALFGALVYVAGRVVGAVIGGDAGRGDWAPYGIALVLLAAGVYQFTTLKRRCLHACRSPLQFLVQHWRPGRLGALRMGVEHGVYCAACCWGLMAVLVAAGAMGLRWVLLIALLVAVEKLLPRGQWAVYFAGVVLLALGVAIAAQPQLAAALRH